MKIAIGRGQDFTMKQGTLEFFHTLQLKWFLVRSFAPRIEVISDRSLFVVTKSFIGKLSKYEGIGMNHWTVASDTIVFEFDDCHIRCKCVVTLNEVHRIPKDSRKEMLDFFIRLIRDSMVLPLSFTKENI